MRRALPVFPTALALALALAPPATAQAVQQQPATTGFDAPRSFAALAKAKLPAVVNISTTQRIGGAASPGAPDLPPGAKPPGMPGLPPGSSLEDFFEQFMGRMMPDMPPRELTALGSGFVIDPAGYVVTNNHVVEGADDIKVILQDDTELHAKLVGRDARTDLALLKVEAAKPLPAVEWGDSDAAQVGDWVLAIGNPFGLGGSVTSGIISARARDIHAGPYDDFLQTDAAINRGNSGGPMFDMSGRVIGVNTAIFSPSGGSIGIGFAIPSSIASKVVAELRQTGAVKRGWLGVSIQSVTPELAESFGLGEPRGALVAQVAPDSPAARAHLQSGDVILSFAGESVDDARELQRLVAMTAVDQQVEIVVWRDGAEKKLSTQIALLKDQDKQQPAVEGSSEGQTQRNDRLGLALAPLSPEMRERFKVDPETQGALVAAIKPGSPAAESGLAPGDVIVQAGGAEVDEPGDVVRAEEEAREAGKKSLLVLRERGGARGFVALPLDQG
jgi:serine protease Do